MMFQQLQPERHKVSERQQLLESISNIKELVAVIENCYDAQDFEETVEELLKAVRALKETA